MSADNFVVVRCFGVNDYRWGNFSMSCAYQFYEDKDFRHGPFPSEEAATKDAEDTLSIIEYGFYDDVLPPDRRPAPDIIDKDAALAVKQKITDELRQQVSELREENKKLRVEAARKDSLFEEYKKVYHETDDDLDKTLSDMTALLKLAQNLHTSLEIEISGHFDPAQHPLLHEAKEALEKLEREYDA
jgi:hypothetical protein